MELATPRATAAGAAPRAASGGAGAGSRFGLSLALAVLALLVLSNAWQLFVLGPDGDPNASGLARALYLPGYAASLALLCMNPRAGAATLWANGLLCAVTAWVLLSALWSVDPSLSLRRGAALVMTTLSGVAIAAAFDFRGLTRTLAAAFLLLGALSLGAGLFVPSLGRMTELFPGAWRGVWLEKNALGDHMALGCLILISAVILDPGRRRIWMAGALLALALVLLSTSKTSLVALGTGGVALALLLLARRSPAGAVAAVFLGVVLALTGVLAALLAPDALLGLAGRDATLTGRTVLWKAILRQADRRPLLGFGYGTVWNAADPFGPWAWITKEAGFKAFEAHDTWLSVRLDLGWSGLCLYALFFAQTWIRAVVQALRSEGAVLVVPALAFLSIEQLTETAGLDYNDFVWTIFAALAARLGYEALLIRRSRRL